MNARPIIPATLWTLCLVMLALSTGCGLLGGNETQNTESNKPQAVRDSTDVRQAEQNLEEAKKEAAQADKRLAKIKDDLKLERDNVTKAKGEAKEQAIEKVNSFVAEEGKAIKAAEDAASKVQVAQAKLDGAKNGGRKEVAQDDDGGGLLSFLPSFTSLILGLCALLILGVLGYAAKMLIDSSRHRSETQFAGIRKRQEELGKQTRDSISGLSQEINTRLSGLQEEVRELRRIIQEDNSTLLDAVRRTGSVMGNSSVGGYQGYQSSTARIEVEEPSFPASAEEYLQKVKGGATRLKSDFNNGILVQDMDNTGEFMLVRDRNVSDLFYVVPLVGYFKTKQDFLNYYDKYYDCQRPSGGTVWIIQPAVVDKVAGGWTLREKGELEVR
ncbi:MAG TPA: cell envelope integrity protein TolA [Pyrinomonadaceae bacterium]|nr:cell envelope integrity protein TolA [Pyrinomonadaceae bacterium]